MLDQVNLDCFLASDNFLISSACLFRSFLAKSSVCADIRRSGILGANERTTGIPGMSSTTTTTTTDSNIINAARDRYDDIRVTIVVFTSYYCRRVVFNDWDACPTLDAGVRMRHKHGT